MNSWNPAASPTTSHRDSRGRPRRNNPSLVDSPPSELLAHHPRRKAAGRDRTAQAHGRSAEPLCAIVHMAVGRALMHHGELEEADKQFGRALELLGIDSVLVHRAHALLLACVRQGNGNLPDGQALVEQARELVEQLADPGSLPALMEQANRDPGSPSRRQIETATPLTEREHAVLRLLPTRLSNQEIGRELYVSVNTVKSQVRAIYRKLEVTSRAEAVTQARHLRLLPGSPPTDRQPSPPDEPQAR